MISVDFQEFVVVVVAPLVYAGCEVMIMLSLFVAILMPLLEIGRIMRRRGQRGI